MQKNTASQKWVVFAYGLPDHASAGQPITGDAANITANVRIDGGAANAVDDTNPTELEDGFYVFDITAAECNGDNIVITPASSTANVQVIGVPGAVYTTPASFNSEALAVASIATEARLAELDAANLPADIDALTTSVGNLSTGSAAISTVAESATVTTGTETLTYTATAQLDGSLHEVADVGNVTQFYYQFDVGGNGVPVEFIWDGYAQSNGDSYAVKAYNWGTTSFDQIGTISGTNSTTLIEEIFVPTNAHVGTGANLGKVRLEFSSSDGTHFVTDRVLCSYAVVSQSVGYSGGYIWLDTVGGTAGTEVYVNGVADNPVDTLADAITLNTTLGLKRFYNSPDSSITFAESHTDEVWAGDGWTLALGGQDISKTHVYHCTVSGIGTTPTGECHLMQCHVGTTTLGIAHITNSSLSSTLTLSAAGDYLLEGCKSGIAGAAAPVIDMGAAVGATNLSVRDWQGGLTLNNLASGDVVTLDGTFGTITLNGADASVEIRGIAKAVTNNLTGSPTVNDNTIKSTDIATIDTNVDAVLVDTGTTLPATLSTIDSEVGQILADTGTDGVVIAAAQTVATVTDVTNEVSADVTKVSGSATAADNLESSALCMRVTTIATAASATSFTLTAGPTIDDSYIGRNIMFPQGTALAGQATPITDYVASTKTVTVGAGGLTGTPTVSDTVVIV